MKKNKMMRIASVLLVAVLLSTCVISGTFAKYTSEFTGTSTAKIAKWDVKVANATNTFTFNLCDTVLDTNGGAAERDVATAEGSTIIAPGTKGQFKIAVTNSSEVNAEYAATFTYKVDGTAVAANTLPITFTATSATGNIAMNNSTEIVVDWVWAFLETDDANTTDLNLAGKEITVEVAVTVSQVD